MERKLFLIWILLIFWSCTEEEPTRTDENLVRNLAAGPMTIDFFEVGGIDRAGDFEGVYFVFLPNGQLEAYRGTQLLDQGAWNTKVDSGRIELELSFSKFEVLTGEWYQVFIWSNQVKLRKDQDDSELILERQ